MLKIDRNARDRVLILTPDGALTQEDLRRLSAAFDEMAADGRKVQGILICAREFPGWASFGAFRDHLRFVRAHQRFIERVAVATDSPILQTMPRLARIFLSPKVSVFEADEVETAREWVEGK